MRKVMVETSAPQNIPAFHPEEIEKFKVEINEYYNSHMDKFKLVDTDGIVKSGDSSNGYYLLVHKGKVEYFAKYKRVFSKLLGISGLRQVLVSRLGHSVASYDIPRKVFFEHLIPTFGSIITDTEQTPEGRRFWENAIAYVLKSHPTEYKIQVLDKRVTPNKVVVVQDGNHFDSLLDKIWGTHEGFKRVLVVITKLERS